jgi:predicted AAA+ superfamily ATPase
MYLVFLNILLRILSIHICQKGDKIVYVQVSETIMDEQTRKTEFRPFEKIKDFYPRIIITNDTLNYSQNGIIHMNIIDFLLSDII